MGWSVIYGIEIYQLKTKDSEINAALLCLGNVSEDFSVDYDSISVDDILDIHKYLMVMSNINKCSGLLNKHLLHYWVLVDP